LTLIGAFHLEQDAKGRVEGLLDREYELCISNGQDSAKVSIIQPVISEVGYGFSVTESQIFIENVLDR
jgi:hypothetical protein